MPVRAWASDAPQAPWSPVIGPGRRSPPGPKAPVKGSVGWSPGAARAQGGNALQRGGPRCTPPGKAAPLRSVAWGHAGRQRRGWL